MEATKEGTVELVAMTNEFNELLYDLDETQQTEELEVDLIKLSPISYYEATAAKDKIARMSDVQINDEERVKKIYFTGMLTHGRSDFFTQYIDPDSRTVRSYYPDFIFQREEPDGSLMYVIVEVRAYNQIEDAVVQAKKDFAQQIAVVSGMEYRTLKSSDADKRQFRALL